jgi:hypothetical protein
MTIQKVNPEQLVDVLGFYADAGWHLHIHGASGIGKSEIVKAFAKARAEAQGLTFYVVGRDPIPADLDTAFAFIDFRTATQDVLDLKGAPKVIDGKTTFAENDQLPDAKVHGKFGIWFVDELSQGMPSVTNGLGQLFTDNQIGNYLFPENWQIVAASNRAIDQAATNKIGAHIHNRFGHVELVSDVTAFAAFLVKKGSNGMLPAFLRLRPELLHQYTKGLIAFCSPRVWEKVDVVIKTVFDRDRREPLIATLVGEGPAAELEGFLAMATQLTTWKQISENPAEARVPEAGGQQSVAAMFAIIGMIVNRVDKDTLPAAITYIERLPDDFQVTFMLDLKAKDPAFFDTLTVSGWRARHNDIAI